MDFNSGVRAARTNAPRCIANLRTRLLDEPLPEYFVPRDGGVWELADGLRPFVFGASETAFFSLGFWEPGDISTPLMFSFAESPGVEANETNANLKIAPIYLDWETQNSAVAPRTLVFDPSAHGYEAEIALFEYKHLQTRLGSFGDLRPSGCENCGQTTGRFRFTAAFRYADKLDPVGQGVPLEDLFEAMILVGVCADCSRASKIFDSAH